MGQICCCLCTSLKRRKNAHPVSLTEDQKALLDQKPQKDEHSVSITDDQRVIFKPSNEQTAFVKENIELRKRNEFLEQEILNYKQKLVSERARSELACSCCKVEPETQSLPTTSKSTFIKDLSNRIVQHNKVLPEFRFYKKRRGTENFGIDYEILMCAYYALKLCFDNEVIDFELTTNNETYGDFDDVALTVKFADKGSHTFLIQLKHAKDDNKTVNSTMLSAEKGDFSVLKYFKSFQTLQNRDHISCILFTNAKSKLEDDSHFLMENKDTTVTVKNCLSEEEFMVDTVDGDDQAAHIFSFQQNGENSQHFQDFSKCFYLFANQKNCQNIQSHIDKMLDEKFGCKIDFNNFMRLWSKGRSVLTKNDVIAKLAELALSPFIQKIPQNITIPEKPKLLIKAIMQFEMTLIKNCKANSIVKIWPEELADLEMLSKTALKYGLSTVGLKNRNELSSEEFTKVLWYLNKVPLIIKYKEKEETRIKSAIDLLAMETTKKKVVLLGRKSKEAFSDWKVFECLHDLKDDTQLYDEITETLQVSLQNRPNISLRKLIELDPEMSKGIEVKDLLAMVEDNFCIGKPLARLPLEYIPRNLTQDRIFISEDEAFSTFTNPINVVIGKAGIGKSTLMTYLSHQCPPEYLCIRVDLIKYSSLFSKKKSTEELLNMFLEDENLIYRNRKMYLLLDGLDEIDSNCVEAVLNFSKNISANGVHVWISSREHLRNDLRDCFNIAPITIQELTEENQETYIHKRLSNEYDNDDEGCIRYTEEEVKEIINRVFKSLNFIYNSKNILGIPLQLFIITEIFRNDRQHFEKLIDEDIFVLTKMYKIFFQGKDRHQKKKAGVIYDKVLGNNLDDTLEQYELPALSSFSFGKTLISLLPSQSSNELSKSQKFLERIRNEGDQLGIISQAVRMYDGTLNAIFSHQSFAEYFACIWLKKNQENLQRIQYLFFKDYNDNLRIIFDVMLAEDSPLHLAVLHKNPDLIKKYIDAYSGERDKGGRNALHLICSHCERSSNQNKEKTVVDSRILEILFQRCNVSEKDVLFNLNCFEYALHRSALLPFEIFLQETDNVRIYMENFKLLLLKLCCFYGCSNLLKKVLNPYPISVGDVGILMENVILGSIETEDMSLYSEIVTILINHGCDINNKTLFGYNYNALQLSCLKGNYNMVKLLLELGVVVNFRTKRGETVLHLAVHGNNLKVIEVLLKTKKIKIDQRNVNNWTALHYASKAGNYEVVRMLLMKGANVNAMTKRKENPLHLALANGNTNLIVLLIDWGCVINACDKYFWTPLHYACSEGRYEAFLKSLLFRGDINAVTITGQTMLHLASACTSRKNKEIVKYLLEKKVNVNRKDGNCLTPLRYACDRQNYDVVEILLENNARLDMESRKILIKNFGKILCKGKIGIVKFLIEHLTSSERITILAHLPPEFPIYLAKKDGCLQPDLLLRMAQLMCKKPCSSYWDRNIGEWRIYPEDIEQLIESFNDTIS